MSNIFRSDSPSSIHASEMPLSLIGEAIHELETHISILEATLGDHIGRLEAVSSKVKTGSGEAGETEVQRGSSHVLHEIRKAKDRIRTMSLRLNDASGNLEV